MRWVTIMPLRNFAHVDRFGRIELGSSDCYIDHIPAWLHTAPILEFLAAIDQGELEGLSDAFIAEYEADAFGSADPEAVAAFPRSIQDCRTEYGVQAIVALWLAKGTCVNSRMIFHAFRSDEGWTVQHFAPLNRLLSHPLDLSNEHSRSDLALSQRVFSGIRKVKVGTAVFTTLRSLWGALITHPPIRYALLWIALEALFGPDDGREMTYRLSQRIAFFLGHDPASRLEWFTTAKRGYAHRSKVVHGRWGQTVEDQTMYDTERMVRTALLKILTREELLEVFSVNRREEYLENLIFGAN